MIDTIKIIMVISIYIAGLSFDLTLVNKREINSKDMRLALIWPITLIISIMKESLWFLNEMFYYFLLIFNYNYKKTNIYVKISTKLLDI